MAKYRFAHFLVHGYIGTGILIGTTALALTTGSTAPTPKTANWAKSPKELIGQVVATELKAQQEDESAWRFKRVTQEDGQPHVYEVVNTPDGPLHRLVSVNGIPLDSADLRKENARIEHLVSDPTELHEHAADEQKDVEEERRLVEMLPVAFNYRYIGRDKDLVKFSFTPNPSFRPEHREGEVFHHMDGTLWVDPTQKRIARIEGRLATEVKFGDGILGHLAKGGTFVVEQSDMGKGRWELTRLDVNMNGEALFFKTISVHQNEQDSDFKPLPGAVSLTQAAEMLKEGAAPQTSSSAGPVRTPWNFNRGATTSPSQATPTADPKTIVFPKNMRNFA